MRQSATQGLKRDLDMRLYDRRIESVAIQATIRASIVLAGLLLTGHLGQLIFEHAQGIGVLLELETFGRGKAGLQARDVVAQKIEQAEILGKPTLSCTAVSHQI